MEDRMLPRNLARKLTPQEVDSVSGGQCFYTPVTGCSMAIEGAIDETNCDGDLECDF